MFRALKLAKWHLPFASRSGVPEIIGPTVGEAFDCCAYVVKHRIFHRPSRLQVFCLCCLIMLSILAVGAVGVTEQLIRNPQRVRVAERAVAQWGRDIVGQVAPSDRQPWEHLVASDPVLVLKICAVPIPSGGGCE
jgi:hypothetical protein